MQQNNLRTTPFDFGDTSFLICDHPFEGNSPVFELLLPSGQLVAPACYAV